jgi:hypothetical protein
VVGLRALPADSGGKKQIAKTSAGDTHPAKMNSLPRVPAFGDLVSDKMRIIASTLALVWVSSAGCAGGKYYWHNPAKTLAEAKRDCLQCRDQAVAEASEAVAEYYYSAHVTPGASNGSERGIAMGDADGSALRGWTAWGETYRENVFRGCMRRKGYRRVRADELDQSVRRRALPGDDVEGR